MNSMKDIFGGGASSASRRESAHLALPEKEEERTLRHQDSTGSLSYNPYALMRYSGGGRQGGAAEN